MNKIVIAITLITFGFFLAAGTAAAATTPISSSSDPLIGIGGILDQIYGWENLQRIDDDFDQIWNPADGEATAKAKYANLTQEFGYIPQIDGGFNSDDFVILFDITKGKKEVGWDGPSGTFNSGNINFLWAMKPDGLPMLTSLQSLNGNVDRMVSWLITGGAGNEVGNYVIAWEDNVDFDFNDLVVEVGVTTVPIPIPPAILLLGSGFVGIVGIRRKVKK